MRTPIRTNNFHAELPLPASEEEKEAMKRALSKEKPSELFKRLQRENDTSRSNASLSRRMRRG
jgi:hypothetical protein